MIKNITLRHRPLSGDDEGCIIDFTGELTRLGVTLLTSYEEDLFVPDIKLVSPEEEKKLTDMVIVFGGDGSILKAAREFAHDGVPVLGVNFGHLGYIAELDLTDTDYLASIVAGDYTTDDRMMLDVSVTGDGRCITPERPALNEVVLANGPVSRLLRYELYCDGIHIQSCRADGIIIATPTGSTAYSMSAGGPVTDPSLECIITTPICPHTLYQIPIVYSGGAVLEIDSISCRENGVYLTLDGDEIIEIRPGDKIKISRSNTRTRIVRVKKRSFLSILHEKMS